jgi:threonylcarbamoyladenosine tRNA methylthiotransferase MtaB
VSSATGMSKPDVVTFGCRLNLVESEEIARNARTSGEVDLVVVNTCAVTSESVRQARQAIRRLHRERPEAEIIVTGCAAQIDKGAFLSLEGVTRVIGNGHKENAARLSSSWDEAFGFNSGQKAISASEGTTRGFLAIQNGCDHRCSFCVIPFGRGPSRSAPPMEIIDEARRLVAAGKREVVLTGVDLTSFGADLDGDWTLGRLTRHLLAELPELERLRLSSIDCIEADAELIDCLAQDARLAPHLHLSLQAGDDLILKRMKRRHSRANAVRFCDEIRAARPDIVFGADFIVGFPTETEEMFRRTLDLVDECGLTHLHVFPFSARPHTPAARMPQVAPNAIKERAARLREAGAQALKRHLAAQCGKTLRVLTERGGVGRALDFTLVRTPQATPGAIVEMVITGHDERALIASPLPAFAVTPPALDHFAL